MPLARGIAWRRTRNQPEREFDLKNSRNSAFECEMSATPIVSRMLCMESDGIPTSTAPQVKGTDNQIKGTDNQIKGTDNQIKGTDKQIERELIIGLRVLIIRLRHGERRDPDVHCAARTAGR